MPIPSGTTLPSNFPQPPIMPGQGALKIFPEDLIAGSRKFYIQIEMVSYNSISLDGTSGWPNGGVVLPLPIKINDTLPIVWREVSMLALGAQMAAQSAYILSLSGRLGRRSGKAAVFAGSGAAGAVGAAASIATGLQINPSLWMMFEHPGFKEHSLTWQLTARNKDESETIADIIHYLKRESLPGRFSKAIYTYPSIAMIKMYPDDKFTFRFKPCAIIAVSVDYSGAGSPAFFRDGSPAIVNLTLTLKEIDLWTKDNYWS